MPDQILSPDKNPSVFESDLKRIESQVNKFKELPEAESMAPREMVKQSIKQMVPAAPAQAPQVPAEPPQAPDESQKTVDYLVGVALTEGIMKANQLAKSAEPYVEDSFHDALVGKYYPELQKRGKIE